jgi:RNA polymerase sigma factor (sigma-70 family)
MRKMLETHKTEAFDPPAAAPSEWSEKEAIAACKEGDHSAFQELVRKYESRIFNHCLRMVDDEQESADLTQEVLVKVYRNIRNYEQTYSFYTWVYRITVNCCIDFLRKKKRKYAGVSLSLGKAEIPAELRNEREKRRDRSTLREVADDHRAEGNRGAHLRGNRRNPPLLPRDGQVALVPRPRAPQGTSGPTHGTGNAMVRDLDATSAFL